MDEDEVTTAELVFALTQPSAAIIEDFPEDTRGHSHLILGWVSDGNPLHVGCALHENEVVIITVYRPHSKYWEADWRTRK